MDTIKSSSFIPKSSLVKSGTKTFYKQAGAGLIFKFTAFLFFLSLLIFGGTFFYKSRLSSEIETLKEPVERAKAAFDPEFIAELEQLMNSLSVAKDIVSQHRYPSHIFQLLEDLTYEEVRFSDFDYSFFAGKKNLALSKDGSDIKADLPEIKASLNGEAKSYTAIAKQAEIFKNSPSVVNAFFSDFNLTESGTVKFSLELTFNPLMLFYE